MGLVGSMGMGSNMMLRSWRKGKGAFVNRRDPNKLAMEVMEELEVVTPSISTPVRRLSGGNVQKVLVGREIAMSPSVLLTAYAVRGLDINTHTTCGCPAYARDGCSPRAGRSYPHTRTPPPRCRRSAAAPHRCRMHCG